MYIIIYNTQTFLYALACVCVCVLNKSSTAGEQDLKGIQFLVASIEIVDVCEMFFARLCVCVCALDFRMYVLCVQNLFGQSDGDVDLVLNGTPRDEL